MNKTDPFPGMPRRSLFVDNTEGSKGTLPTSEGVRVRAAKPTAADVLGGLSIDGVRRGFDEAVAKKTGRPALGDPWKELGISERTYHRRKKAGTL